MCSQTYTHIIYIHTHNHASVWIAACIHVCRHVCMYVYMNVYIYLCMLPDMHESGVCMYECTCLHACVANLLHVTVNIFDITEQI